MIESELEDVSIERLRKEGQRLGIENANTKQKDALIAEIRDKRTSLPKEKKRWNASLVISIISLVIALVAAAANWGKVWLANEAMQLELSEMNEANAKLEKEEWQELIVYSIIEKRFSAQTGTYTGVSFDAIKSEYLQEAQAIQGIEIDREDIQPVVLRKILFDLMQSGLVYMTHDKGYAVNLSELLPGFGRTMLKQSAGYRIIELLAPQGAKFTELDLQTKICNEFKLTPHEFYLLIVQLKSEGAIEQDKDGNFVSVLRKSP